MIRLIRGLQFKRIVRVIVINNPSLKTRIARVLYLLRKNPFHPSLKTTRIYTKRKRLHWSSVVTDEMRIIWDFMDTKKTKIMLLTIGGNQEPLKVYREITSPLRKTKARTSL